MRMNKKNSLRILARAICLVFIVLLIPFGSAAGQIPDFLAAWCPLSLPVGATAQSSTHHTAANAAAMLTRSSGAAITTGGNGTRPEDTPYSYYGNGWHSPAGQWWQLSNLSTAGFENIYLSFSVRGTATGPRNFALQYSIDGAEWVDVVDGSEAPVTYFVNADNNFHQEGPFLLPAAVDDSDVLFIRFLNTDTQSVGGATVASGGTNNISNIIITGTPVVSDEREIMSAWVITLGNANDNHAYYASNPGQKPQFAATAGVYAETSAFLVEKVQAATGQPHPINTSLTGGNALYADGVRYQGLEIGSFWMVETSSAGFSDVSVNWAMRCSNSAPANYQMQYSIDYDPDAAENATWIPVGSDMLLTQDIPIRFPQAHYTRSLPGGADNQQKLFIRLYITNNMPIQGVENNANRSNGVFSINNIRITGLKIPTLPKVTANPEPGEVPSGTAVTLSNAVSGTAIYYSINGGPEEVYTTPIALADGMFVGDPAAVSIEARAEKDGYNHSEKSVFVYALKPETTPPQPDDGSGGSGGLTSPGGGLGGSIGSGGGSTNPDDATNPEDTVNPGDTTNPGDTADPDDAADPDDTTPPDDAADPDDATAPDDAEDPDDATAPDDAEDPDDTTAPDDAADPDDATNPDGSYEPQPYTPGGTDPDVPPVTSKPGSTLVPTEDGGYIEMDENGIPLGEWYWDDEPEMWVFDEYPPLSAMPRTGNNGVSVTSLLLLMGFFLLSTGIVLRSANTRKPQRGR